MSTDSFNGEIFDVAIVGGGPAGTTAGALLARRGFTVVLFEREEHPRFHIGESLLPMNLPILEELGLLEKVRAIGIQKMGADFTASESSGRYHTFQFSRALGDSPHYAFQVRRSEFDHLLFDNCRAIGVKTVQQCRVTHVSLSGDDCHEVKAVTNSGRELQLRCRYLLDASGQSTLLASQQKWRVRNREHAAAAMFTHFEGVETRAGDESGNISIYWFEHGWIWMIPLTDGVMSIGAVCRPDYLKSRSGSQDSFLDATMQLSPAAAERVRSARQLQPVQVAANYSYYSRQQTGPGYALIGDAYAFVDPIFSSGVYLAMSSARDVVPLVELWLKGDASAYRKASRDYRRRIRRGIDTFSWFIYRFTTPAMTQLFRQPRNILGVEQAVIAMLAGNVYESWSIRVRLWLFRIIYQVARIAQSIRQATRKASS